MMFPYPENSLSEYTELAGVAKNFFANMVKPSNHTTWILHLRIRSGSGSGLIQNFWIRCAPSLLCVSFPIKWQAPYSIMSFISVNVVSILFDHIHSTIPCMKTTTNVETVPRFRAGKVHHCRFNTLQQLHPPQSSLSNIEQCHSEDHHTPLILLD